MRSGNEIVCVAHPVVSAGNSVSPLQSAIFGIPLSFACHAEAERRRVIRLPRRSAAKEGASPRISQAKCGQQVYIYAASSLLWH
jgi:hypothetical protein